MYEHITSYVLNTPWAILPDKLCIILDVLRFRASGGRLTTEEIRERIGAASKPAPRSLGAIAVLPLYGTIAHRADMMMESSGGTSTERFGKMFRQALNDPQVGAIVIDVDSPGGAVSGVAELADLIYGARGQKPITAVANTLAASAGYWLATAADEVVVTPSGEVGSIGVFAAHQDWSKAYELKGIKTTLVSAGKYKTESNPYEPLTDEAKAAIQERVSDYYDLFVRSVARGRGVKPADVREGFGQGRVVGAKQAVSLGMADRVATLEETIERMGKGMRRSAANAEFERLQWEIDLM